MRESNTYLGVLFGAALLFSGCGGGGGDPAGPDAGSTDLRVDVGDDQTLHEPADSLNLMAVVTGDGAADATLTWTQTAGAAATLAGATTTTLAVSDLGIGIYTFEVTATSGAATASDEVTVTVLADNTRCDGATFYVDAGGDDGSGDGSAGNPWQTVAKATTEVTTAGATIRVNAGTYTETATSQLAQGVCLEGDGASTTILKGANDAEFTAMLELTSADGTSGHQHISGLTFDGQYVDEGDHQAWLAIWVTGRSDVSIHDCVIKDFRWRGVIFNGITTDNPGTDEGFTHATGNSFYGNELTNSADYGISGGGSGSLNIGFQEGMLIYDNLIRQDERPEGLNGWPIKYWNQGWNKAVKIYRNTLIKKPYGGTYPGESGWDFAIELFLNKGLEIFDNDIQNGAIDLNYNYRGDYAFSIWIHDNVISNPTPNPKVEGGIILEFRTEAVVIERNVIRNKAYGVSFNTRGVDNYGGDQDPFPGGTPVGGYSYLVDNVIQQNLFEGMYTGEGVGNSFAIGVISEGTDDPQINSFHVYNNTMIGEAGNPSYVGIDLGSMPQGNGVDVDIRNNIVTGFANDWLVGSNPSNLDGVIVSANDVVGNGSDDATWPGGEPANYTATGNLSVDPMFAADWTLTAGSPCIDAGEDVGLPFEGAAPDLGFAESAP